MMLKYEPEIIAGTITGFCAVIAACVAAYSSIKAARRVKSPNGKTVGQMVAGILVATDALKDGQHQIGKRVDVIREEFDAQCQKNENAHQAIIKEQQRVAEELTKGSGGSYYGTA